MKNVFRKAGNGTLSVRVDGNNRSVPVIDSGLSPKPFPPPSLTRSPFPRSRPFQVPTRSIALSFPKGTTTGVS